jgi:uncharacterized membrane protein (DUF2068 family)
MRAYSGGETARGARERSDAVGLRLLVGYKLVKALTELLFAALVPFLGSAGLAEELHAIALTIRHHAAEAWSIALAERLVHAATERNLRVVALASLFDGVLSSVEGWALHRRYWWSRWLVVVTTSCLLPFEGVELLRHPSAGRVALLLVNALIVIYLVRRGVAVAPPFPQRFAHIE